jgi:hypothetical protein
VLNDDPAIAQAVYVARLFTCSETFLVEVETGAMATHPADLLGR